MPSLHRRRRLFVRIWSKPTWVSLAMYERVPRGGGWSGSGSPNDGPSGPPPVTTCPVGRDRDDHRRAAVGVLGLAGLAILRRPIQLQLRLIQRLLDDRVRLQFPRPLSDRILKIVGVLRSQILRSTSRRARANGPPSEPGKQSDRQQQEDQEDHEPEPLHSPKRTPGSL